MNLLKYLRNIFLFFMYVWQVEDFAQFSFHTWDLLLSKENLIPDFFFCSFLLNRSLGPLSKWPKLKPALTVSCADILAIAVCDAAAAIHMQLVYLYLFLSSYCLFINSIYAFNIINGEKDGHSYVTTNSSMTLICWDKLIS
jgi:hypothetical protein